MGAPTLLHISDVTVVLCTTPTREKCREGSHTVTRVNRPHETVTPFVASPSPHRRVGAPAHLRGSSGAKRVYSSWESQGRSTRLPSHSAKRGPPSVEQGIRSTSASR